jgi:dihydrofolate synthase / folylpolyglutamate synthase
MSSAALDRVLSDLHSQHPRAIDLSLDRIARLLEKLGNPHLRLPPVFHVAGTNGKGSTVAFLRACLEAAGKRVHVYTSPHLVRFNERIRLAGQLIDDDMLASTLSDVRAMNRDDELSFFEATTAAAFLAFARIPADAVVLEVGLGGRLDATNVVPRPAVCGIAQLGLDHQHYLGNTMVKIAYEKASIAKRAVPLVHQRYDRLVAQKVAEIASLEGAPLVSRGSEWDVAGYQGHLHYKDREAKLELPLPRMAGAHQIDNAGLALAMLRHQSAIQIPESALRAGLGWADWPARLQKLSDGPLPAMMTPGSALWLDGGHNPAAAKAIAGHFQQRGERPTLLLAMLANKDVVGFLKPFAGVASGLIILPMAADGHDWHPPEALQAAAQAAGIAARPVASLQEGLRAAGPLALVCGSLYLAGKVLEANGSLPG